MDKTTEELYREREKRFVEAIQLKIPDRVPVVCAFSYFPAKYTGITCEAAYYDYDNWLEASKKTVIDFAPDIASTETFYPGKVLEYLEPRQLLWPGHGSPPDHGHQAVEGEWMQADEYDALMSDPSDYSLRVYLPRTVGAMEPFKMLPPLSTLGYGYRGALALAEAFARPEVASAIETLQKVGQEFSKWRSRRVAAVLEIEKLGFPRYSRLAAGAPFDMISDNLRGMRGAMLDIYRQPDRLLEACEQMLQNSLKQLIPAAKSIDNPRIFMALHRGSDGFMSLKQFETFYWPTLKRLIVALVDEGLTPCIFFEGDYTSRLEYLLELPGGKILAHFDSTDIFKAKEVLKGHMSIMGNVPSSLLQTGTVQEVKNYCRELIDVVGKDGGFIMASRSSLDEVQPANLKAMIDFTKEYGIYR